MIELLLCIVELVYVLADVPVLEVSPDIELRVLKGLVVNYRKGVVDIDCGIHDVLPDMLVLVVTEHQVVDQVVHGEVVKLLTFVDEVVQSGKEGLVKLGVAGVSNTVGVGNVTKIPG